MSTEAETLTATAEEVGDVHCVRLTGSLCDDGISVARQVIIDTLSQGATRIAVNMEAVDYISSSGIGMLVSILKRCFQQKVQMALCGLNEDIRELFALTRLDQVFTIARDVKSWRKSLA